MTAAATSAPRPARDATPVYKKWWLWTAVGVAVAIVVTGMAAGLTPDNASMPKTANGNQAPVFR